MHTPVNPSFTPVNHSLKVLKTPRWFGSTDLSKAVVPVLVLLFVALCFFFLRGDLMYVFPCVILFLCFSALLVLRLPRLGKRELILVLLVRLFGLCLFRFVGFLFLLGSGKGCGVWLWHSQDFFLLPFLEQNSVSFPLVHQSKDADNDRVTVVVLAVDDDDNEYGYLSVNMSNNPHQPTLQGQVSTSPSPHNYRLPNFA